MKKFLTLILFLSLSLFAASFDCTKAQNNVEKMICSDEKLAKLDNNLSQIYSDFYFLSKEIKSDQREWMKLRNQCKDIDCILKAYKSRIVDLNTSLNNEITFPKEILDTLTIVEKAKKIETNTICQGVAYQLFDNNSSKTYCNAMKKCGDFCKQFYDDLFRFNNISVRAPTLEGLDYNDTEVIKALGSCHKMRLDIDSAYMVNFGIINTTPSVVKHNQKASIRLWTDYSDNYDKVMVGVHYGDNYPKYYLVDKKQCDKVTSKRNFNYLYDRKFEEETQLNQNNGIETIHYKKRNYILEIADFDERFSIALPIGLDSEHICYKNFFIKHQPLNTVPKQNK